MPSGSNQANRQACVPISDTLLLRMAQDRQEAKVIERQLQRFKGIKCSENKGNSLSEDMNSSEFSTKAFHSLNSILIRRCSFFQTASYQIYISMLSITLGTSNVILTAECCMPAGLATCCGCDAKVVLARVRKREVDFCLPPREKKQRQAL